MHENLNWSVLYVMNGAYWTQRIPALILFLLDFGQKSDAWSNPPFQGDPQRTFCDILNLGFLNSSFLTKKKRNGNGECQISSFISEGQQGTLHANEGYHSCQPEVRYHKPAVHNQLVSHDQCDHWCAQDCCTMALPQQHEVSQSGC